MSLYSEKVEVAATVNRLLDKLSLTISSQTGTDGIKLRQKIGDLRANYLQSIYDGDFSTKLLDCFTTSRLAGATLASMAVVREDLFVQTPTGSFSSAIVLMAIVFSLSAEARMITNIKFVSRNDIDVKMAEMRAAFDTARELAADGSDSSAYQQLTFLAGSLTNYLSTTARPLPRMLTFNLVNSFPALVVSNLIYYTAERWEEIILENKTIHPAFCQRDLVGLSS